MPHSKAKRAQKTSKGEHGGARKTRLTEVQKVLISNGGCLKAVTQKRTNRARKILIAKEHDLSAKDMSAYI